MARNRLLLAGMMLLGASFSITAGAASPWEPLVPGDPVSFLLPDVADQPAATTDAAIFSGGTISELDVGGGGCGFGIRSVQHYVLLDPSGVRSPRLGGVIALTSLPIQPSTRIGGLTFDSACTIGGIGYMRYSGTVQ